MINRFLLSLFLLASCGFSDAALAFEEPHDLQSEKSIEACKPDIDQFCPGIPFGSVLNCLIQHEVALNESCRSSVETAKQKGMTTPKSPPPFVPAAGVSFLPPQMTLFSYGGSVTPRNGSTFSGLERFSFQTPVYRTESETVAVSSNVSNLQLGPAKPLSNSGVSVPNDLWKIEAGAQYAKILGGDRTIGGRITVGSASDTPFSNFNVTTIGASAEYSFPTSDRSRWLLMLMFSNNSPIINYVPLPGFAYSYNTEAFSVIAGFPATAVRWSPIRKVNASFSLLGPNLASELSYGNSFGGIQEFIGFSWGAQSFLQQNRTDNEEHFYYAEKRAYGGLRLPVSGPVNVDLTAGYAFERAVFTQDRYFFNVTGNSSNLGNSWFTEWNLRMTL